MLDLFVRDAVSGGKVPTIVGVATEQDLAATKDGRQVGKRPLRVSCRTRWRCGGRTIASYWD